MDATSSAIAATESKHTSRMLVRSLLEKTVVVTTLCRNTAINVKPIALRHWDGQLKYARREKVLKW